MQRFLNLKIGVKFLCAFLACGLGTIATIGYIGYSAAKNSMEKEAFSKLTAIREIKASQIESYFQQIRDQVVTFSENRMIIDAMKEFKNGFYSIDKELGITNSKMGEIDSRIKNYYRNEFLAKLNSNLDKKVSVSDYWPKDKRTRILQDLYMASNSNETGSKHKLDYAGDGSSYSRAHKKYHPVIRSYLEKFGYYDIFLVDPETGYIVYTVFKEVDYGTSLLTGPYSGTNFADVFKAARDSSHKDFAKMEDFRPYHPSYNAAASFIGSPIYDGNEKIGALLFQMPIDRINDIMTNKNRWSDIGLGASGETYIVGDDFTIKNQSRFLIEDKKNYFKMIKEIGLPQTTIDKIKNMESAIGLQTVRTKGTEAAMSGITRTEIFTDYRGVPVLSAYKPLNIKDTHWVIMSEIDVDETFEPVYSLRNHVLLWSGLLTVLIVVIAIAFARTISAPLKKVVSVLKVITEGDLRNRLDYSAKDEIGDMSESFNAFVDKLHAMIGNIADVTNQLASSATQTSTVSKQSTDVVRRQTEQTTQVAAAIEEMSATLLEVAKNTTEALDSSKKTMEIASKGGKIVADTVKGMGRIEQSVNESSNIIEVLGKNSEQINNIISVIDDIADQTNLLALNAAIEAARAGEQGRGFAVVADEVRKLAERTTTATKEVAEMIKIIQSDTNKTVSSMETVTKEVSSGVKSINQAGNALKEVVDMSKTMTDRVTEIATASEQQSAD